MQKNTPSNREVAVFGSKLVSSVGVPDWQFEIKVRLRGSNLRTIREPTTQISCIVAIFVAARSETEQLHKI